MSDNKYFIAPVIREITDENELNNFRNILAAVDEGDDVHNTLYNPRVIDENDDDVVGFGEIGDFPILHISSPQERDVNILRQRNILDTTHMDDVPKTEDYIHTPGLDFWFFIIRQWVVDYCSGSYSNSNLLFSALIKYELVYDDRFTVENYDKLIRFVKENAILTNDTDEHDKTPLDINHAMDVLDRFHEIILYFIAYPNVTNEMFNGVGNIKFGRGQTLEEETRKFYTKHAQYMDVIVKMFKMFLIIWTAKKDLVMSFYNLIKTRHPEVYNEVNDKTFVEKIFKLTMTEQDIKDVLYHVGEPF